MSLLMAMTISCASCGSGGDSPLILYPNERVKAYVGLTQNGDRLTVFPSGRTGEDLGPETRRTATVAFGTTLSTDWFATLTIPYVTNARAGREDSDLGDVLAETRWTVQPMSLLAPAKPQIQLVAAYQGNTGRSIYDSEDENQLDVFGKGFSEGHLGVDVWWGARRFKYGFASSLRLPETRSVAGASRRPGRGIRGAATAAYDLTGTVKLTGGTTIEARERRMAEEEFLPDSEVLDHGLYTALDCKVTEQSSARFTLARSAAYGQNKNTTQATSMTVALMGSL